MTSLAQIEREVRAIAFRPIPKRTLSKWADDEVTLAPTEGGGAGKWYTERAAYLREPMDAMCDQGTRELVVKKSGQAGATLALSILPVLYWMVEDPTTVMIVQPSESLAAAWSVARFEPNRLETPATRDLIQQHAAGGARHAGNTQQFKAFPGGYVVVAWASSDMQMRSRPARVIIRDELNAWEPTKEGDSAKRAERAATTYEDSKKVLDISTPTVKGASRIDDRFDLSDQRYYHVPCPDCGHRQPLVWENVRYDGKDPETSPETARYVCRDCGTLWDEAQKNEAVRIADLNHDAWVPTYPGRKIAGWHINAIMSSFVSMAELVKEWLEAQGNDALMQVFFNLKLGLAWELRTEGLGNDNLLARREIYAAQVPAGVAILTASIDVQDDRFEIQVEGWGAGGENWKIQHHVIPGDVLDAGTQRLLDDFLRGRWRHESGTELRLRAACMDAGDGDHTQMVYAFTKKRWRRRVFAVKGLSKGDGKGLVRPRPSVDDKSGAKFFLFAPNTAKDMVLSMFRTQVPGPRYVHLPDSFTEDWVTQVLVERKHPKRMPDGSTKWVYRKPGGARNEALDLCTMNLVALSLSGIPVERLARMAARLQAKMGLPEERAEETDDGPSGEPAPAPTKTKKPVVRKASGWMNRWRFK
jgi:phage terminase large subunit GpA-like protein